MCSGGERDCGLFRFVDCGSAGDGVGDARADIFRAHVAFEFGLLHELGGLFAGAAEEEMAAGGVQAVGEFANGAEAGSVDGSHVAEAKNDDGRESVDAADDFVEFVGGAK